MKTLKEYVIPLIAALSFLLMAVSSFAMIWGEEWMLWLKLFSTSIGINLFIWLLGGKTDFNHRPDKDD